MRIYLEWPAFPLFAGGVALVIVMELVLALLVLRKYPDARGGVLAHLVCIALAFSCLGSLLFDKNPAVPFHDGRPHTGRFVFFGIFWCIGEIRAECGPFGKGREKNKKIPD